MKHKLFTLIFAIMASFGSISAESGTCGSNLTWDLTDSVLTISGTGAMTNYSYSNSPWYSNRNSIRIVVISNGVTSIGNYAFWSYSNLISVSIANSVASIGSHALEGCSGLISIEIPNSVMSIGSMAFSNVNNIIYSGSATGSPWGAKSINGYVEGCFVYSDDSKTTLLACSSNATGEISIPNSVTSIGKYAFSNCSNLTSMIIPNSVTSIGNSAFSNCSNLTSMIIPNSVTYIGADAFLSCSKLVSVIIPSSVINIGNRAFYGCNNLSSIDIPNSVTSIGYATFMSCTNLTSVTIPNSVTSIGNYAFYGCSSLTQIEIPSSITTIGNHAFDNCTGLTSVEIPNSVTNIGEYAFNKCSSIISINIPNNVTRIGQLTFMSCVNLASVTIGNSVDSIEASAFCACSSLTSVEIPSSVSFIGGSAFQSCSGLKFIVCKANTPPILGSDPEDFVFYYIDKSIPLYVPEGSINLYKAAKEWKDFTYIRAIGSVPVVKFIDWNATVLSSVYVDIGSAATPPSNPTREGYTFIGWDKDFSNVTKDMTVTAQYKINRYKVEFVDWDNTLLKSDSLNWNTAAVAPANPSREGFEFIGWDKPFEHITSDLVIKAQYWEGQTIDYNMTFINGQDESEIYDEVISIKVPAAPIIQGFTFKKWVVVSGDLEEGITIQAVYTANTPTSAPEVYTNPTNPAQKLIRNGNVYILKVDKTYTIQGQEVR